MDREYCGLPVTLASEAPKVIAMYAQMGSRGDFDVGRGGLMVRIVDSDPYYDGLIYQHGVPVAVVHCLSGKTGLAKGLAEEDPKNLMVVFGIEL